jgi:uncharacterized protein (DUF1499 family)
MIIKSKSWLSNNVGKLFNYIDKEDSFEIFNNFKSREGDKSTAIREMYHQNSLKRRRVNGKNISHFHEILSLSKKDEAHVSLDMLHTLATEYIRLRCPNSLCYAKAHLHGKNKHVHFVISASEIGGKNLRISRKRFKNIKHEIEKIQIKKFPQLENSIVHTGNEKENSRTKNNDIEKHTKKRTKKALEKEKVSELVCKAVSGSKSIDDLRDSLRSGDIELYFYREKPSGVIYNDKKYRWSTLGIEKERIEQLIAMQKEKDMRMEQLNEIHKLNNDKSINKGMER